MESPLDDARKITIETMYGVAHRWTHNPVPNSNCFRGYVFRRSHANKNILDARLHQYQERDGEEDRKTGGKTRVQEIWKAWG